MRRDLNEVTKWLLRASSQVGPEYFQLPVAGREEPDYRERVYCYELYHLWRCHWRQGFPFSLSGEVDKQHHPLIRGGAKPDFLVHIPGHMSNLLVIEVKPRNAAVKRIADDLKKLTMFRHDLPQQDGVPGNYYAAYLWLYGLPVEEWGTLRDQVLRAVAPPGDFDPSLVSCFIHEKAGAEAVKVAWE